MNLADVAPAPTASLTALGCAALGCLFLVSTVVLVIVLLRRGRKAGTAAS